MVESYHQLKRDIERSLLHFLLQRVLTMKQREPFSLADCYDDSIGNDKVWVDVLRSFVEERGYLVPVALEETVEGYRWVEIPFDSVYLDYDKWHYHFKVRITKEILV